MGKHIYSEEEIKFIKENCVGITTIELTERFNKHFNLKLRRSQIRAFMKNHKLKNGVNLTFKKGNIPYNKGTKGICKANNTSFKKGHIPVTIKPIGSERTDVDGYILVKVSNEGTYGKKWQPKHKLLWQKYHNQDVPEGYVVAFADQDKTNLSKENLILISRRELLSMNNRNKFSEIAEITKLNILLTKLNIKKKDLKKKGMKNEKNQKREKSKKI